MKKRILFTKLILVLCSFMLCAPKSSFGQQLKIKKVQAVYGSDAVPEVFYQVPIGFTFFFNDGSKKATRGILGGKIPWRKLKVISEQGDLKGDQFYFNPAKVWRNCHKATFKINYEDTMIYSELNLPYVMDIKFNLYTDSIKRNVPYYLNVEGEFSNDKVFPLDTSQIVFSVSKGGIIKKNILKVRENTTEKEIKVTASFKRDERLTDSVFVPIKTHIDNPDLPSENELFRRWEKKKRKRRR